MNNFSGNPKDILLTENINLEKSVSTERTKRPSWLKVKAPGGDNYTRIKTMMRAKELHTVCEEAHCPNIGECWSCGTATFIILGDICARNCRFCAVKTGIPLPPDEDEPQKVAESINSMRLKHAVITSVTRDDLPDGGAKIWKETILEIRKMNPMTTIEVLIPDFMGNHAALRLVFEAKPDILNHNVETVPSLYALVRPKADYRRSLSILRLAKEFGLRTKTGLMLGLGETDDEVLDVMRDLRKIGVKILTLGQYLRPSKEHLSVQRYVSLEEFSQFKTLALAKGFEHVESAPLVRSSYHAERQISV